MMPSINRLPMPNTYLKLMSRASRNLRVLLAGTGLSEADLAGEDTLITVDQQLRSARNSAAMARRPDWHLAWATRVAEHYHGPITLALLSAPTLVDGIEVFARHMPSRIPYLAWRTQCEGALYRCEVWPLLDLGEIQSVLIEVPLLALLAYVRTVRAGFIKEITVELSHPPAADRSFYRQSFDCRFEFEASHCALIIPAAWRQIANLGHDEVVWCAALRQCASAAATSTTSATVDIVARALMKGFTDPVETRSPPTLESMAGRLHVSVRTLNRRLKVAGTSYQTLVDDVRKSLARELLLDERVSIERIAERLGFGDPGSLNRAFKRWYATTPKCYRRRLTR